MIRYMRNYKQQTLYQNIHFQSHGLLRQSLADIRFFGSKVNIGNINYSAYFATNGS